MFISLILVIQIKIRASEKFELQIHGSKVECKNYANTNFGADRVRRVGVSGLVEKAILCYVQEVKNGDSYQLNKTWLILSNFKTGEINRRERFGLIRTTSNDFTLLHTFTLKLMLTYLLLTKFPMVVYY